MKYKAWDYQCERYMGDCGDNGVVFESKAEAVDYLVSYFSVDQTGNLTAIRKSLWKNNEYSEIEIKELSECD